MFGSGDLRPLRHSHHVFTVCGGGIISPQIAEGVICSAAAVQTIVVLISVQEVVFTAAEKSVVAKVSVKEVRPCVAT